MIPFPGFFIRPALCATLVCLVCFCCAGNAPAASRFIKQGEEVIVDTHTGLEWKIFLNSLGWSEAQSMVSSAAVSGGNWRMPRVAELEQLYLADQWNESHNLAPIFRARQLNIWYVWADERDERTAWCYALHSSASFFLPKAAPMQSAAYWAFGVREKSE